VNLVPSYPEFEKLYKKYPVVPVFAEIPADTITPLGLFQSGWKSGAYNFLLESVEGGEHLGRYSFLGFQPREVIECRGPEARVKNAQGRLLETHPCRDPLDFLRQRMGPFQTAPVPGLPRFFGGAVGYIGYDVVRTIERLPDHLPDKLGLPDMVFMITDNLAVFDHISHALKIVHCVRKTGRHDARKRYHETRQKIEETLRQLGSHPPATYAPKGRPARGGITSRPSPKAFIDSVLKAKEHIRQGDIIQVVLSRVFQRHTRAGPLNIYKSLRSINPSPYMYLLSCGDHQVIGTSPELLIRLENGVAATRPIAGTRPRGIDETEDDRFAQELLQDAKERAEHLMLVDLGRNDLGRACLPGSVKVPTFMKIEKFSHVMHITSEVTGRLGAGSDAFDLFKASFPAGTVTGAPKIRAMEIIDELETQKRGPYAGAVGYFGYSGNMDMAITIRTVVLKNREAWVQAGAGIVADSQPLRELAEIQNKATAGLKALTEAERNLS
jgi:anthranilate synthase component 1